MIECDTFHETKRERKFYEDKKQKALRYLDHTIDDLNTPPFGRFETLKKLDKLRELVKDI